MNTTTTTTDLKELVREKYGAIAQQDISVQQASCCGATPCSTEVYTIMTDDYSDVAGYVAEADLGLGCGLPTQFAQIQPGNTVVDLGSGAGNDCFVARNEAGATGRIIGIDFTPAMLEKARTNAQKLGYDNVEFLEGDIEAIPLADSTAHVVVSNCVLNLVPDKSQVFREIYRVLQTNGHFSISDIVLLGDLPPALQQDAEMYAGCVAGALQKEDYLALITQAGFVDITIQKEKPIVIPDDILRKYLTDDEVSAYHTGSAGIVSITVFGKKA
jgi:arsenite methyltransferase